MPGAAWSKRDWKEPQVNKALHSHRHQGGEKTKRVHLVLNPDDLAALCSSLLRSLLHSASSPSQSVPPSHPSLIRRLFHLLPLWPPSSHHSPSADVLSPLGAHLRLTVSLPTPSPISSFCSTCPPPAAILLFHCAPCSFCFPTYLRLLFQPLRPSLLTFLPLAKPSHPFAWLKGAPTNFIAQTQASPRFSHMRCPKRGYSR